MAVCHYTYTRVNYWGNLFDQLESKVCSERTAAINPGSRIQRQLHSKIIRSRQCDGTGFSSIFLPSIVPYSRLYMWLRVLLISRSLLAYLATFACRVLHLCKLTPSLTRCKLNYLSAPSQLHLDFSRSIRSAFPSKFYYLALYYHPSIQLDFCPRDPPSCTKPLEGTLFSKMAKKILGN